MMRCLFLADGDIGGGNQVLLWGDASDMAALAFAFRAMAQTPELAQDHDHPLSAHIRVLLADPASGMSRDGERLSWSIGAGDASHFADLADALAEGPGGGHQYLDVSTAMGIEVKLSLGEYPEDWRPPF